MAKFIELTKHNKTRNAMVNVDHIVFMEPDEEGSRLFLSHENGGSIIFDQTLDDIRIQLSEQELK